MYAINVAKQQNRKIAMKANTMLASVVVLACLAMTMIPQQQVRAPAPNELFVEQQTDILVSEVPSRAFDTSSWFPWETSFLCLGLPAFSFAVDTADPKNSVPSFDDASAFRTPFAGGRETVGGVLVS
jgi:hypothetical protein